MRDETLGVVTALPAPRLLRFPQVRDRTGIGPTKCYELIKQGKFPAPVKVGAASFWVEHEVEGFISSRIAERDAARAEQAVAP